MKLYLKVACMTVLVLAVVFSSATAKVGKRAWLGVYTQSVDEDLAEAFDLGVKYGAVVNDVVRDSPADEAGLKEDDIIVSFGGSKVTDEDDLLDLVAEAKSGDEVEVEVVRGDDNLELVVTLGDRTSREIFFKSFRGPDVHTFDHNFFTDDYGYVGVTLLNISDEVAEVLGAEDGGILINEVERSSPADEAGLKAGDIIITVDDEEIYDAGDVRDIIQDLDEGDIAKFEVVRDKKRQSIDVEVKEVEDGHFPYESMIFSLPDIPNLNLKLPKMRGLHYGLDSDFRSFDSEEFQDEMTELKKELKRLQKEMKELKRSLR